MSPPCRTSEGSSDADVINTHWVTSSVHAVRSRVAGAASIDTFVEPTLGPRGEQAKMNERLRGRICGEVVLATIAAILGTSMTALLTGVGMVFDRDPDGGSGALASSTVVVSFAVSSLAALASWREAKVE